MSSIMFIRRSTWWKLALLGVLSLAILIGTAVFFIDFAYISSSSNEDFIVPWILVQLVFQTILVRRAVRIVKADLKSQAARSIHGTMNSPMKPSRISRLTLAGVAVLVVSGTLPAGDFKLFPEPRVSNPLPALGTSAPLVVPAPSPLFEVPATPPPSWFVTAYPDKVSPLSAAYFGVASRTQQLRRDTQRLVVALNSGDDAARITALRNCGASADSLSMHVRVLQSRIAAAGELSPAAAETYARSLEEARDTLMTHERLHDVAVGDIDVNAKVKW